MSAYPSPWWFARHDEASWAVGCGDGEIAVKVPDADTARLMRAAPDLLAALQEVTPPMPPADAPCHAGIVSQNQCAHCQRIARARAAIAKATGDTL